MTPCQCWSHVYILHFSTLPFSYSGSYSFFYIPNKPLCFIEINIPPQSSSTDLFISAALAHTHPHHPPTHTQTQTQILYLILLFERKSEPVQEHEEKLEKPLMGLSHCQHVYLRWPGNTMLKFLTFPTISNFENYMVSFAHTVFQ